jgi:tetratricopeptide (TPR) repeat protein
VGVFFLLTAFLGSSAFLVVFTRLAWTPIAERYMYIPCGLFAVAAVFGTADLVERFAWQKYCLAVVPLLFGIYGWATVDRNIVWQDNLTLYQDTVRKSPDFGPANNELALALYSHNRPAEAASVIATAKIPSGQKSSLNQAAAFAEQGRYREALIFLRQRLVNPGSNEIHILVTLVRVASEAAEKSKVQTEKNILYRDIVGWLERLEFLTHDPFHWYQLGRVHMILKNKQEAQRCFSKAAIRLPADSIYKEPAAKLARKLVL